MTLTRYSGQYEELLKNCILHWTGVSETNLGFPIIPNGVTVTPAGTWANPLNLGTNKSLKTFDGYTNYIALSDNDAWNIFGSDFTISMWCKRPSGGSDGVHIGQQIITGSTTDKWFFHWSGPWIYLYAIVGGTVVFYYYSTYVAMDNAWNHVTVQRSGSNCLMYVNDELRTVTVTTAWSGVTVNIAQPLEIGWDGTFSKGNIKDLVVFTRALTLQELVTIMRLTHPTTGRYDFYPVLSGKRGVE